MEVQKRDREKDAVRGFTFTFTFTFTNGVYGLLGENGAGKTTLMRLICGILQPTNGSITCDNIRISDMGTEYRRLLGYLPQDFGYYGDFTAVRFLNYMATLKALPRDYAKGRVEELLELVDLKDVKNKKLKTYSGGMLRRIGIAQALLNDLHHSVSTYKLHCYDENCEIQSVGDYSPYIRHPGFLSFHPAQLSSLPAYLRHSSVRISYAHCFLFSVFSEYGL